MGHIERNTLFFSSLMAADSNAVGGSIAMKTENLEEVGDDHVLEGPGGLVEADPIIDREHLGDVDLDMIDVVTVPDGLEESVGKAEGQDVLGRLLAQEVIYSKDLLFGEDLVHRGVEVLADSRSVPKGFSMMMRDRSTRSASPSIWITSRAEDGGMLR